MKQEVLDALRGTEERAVEDAGPYGGEPAVSAVSGGDSSQCRGAVSDDPSAPAGRLLLRRGGEEEETLSVTAASGDDSSPKGRAKETSGSDLSEIRAHWEKLAAEAAGIEGFDLREALRDPAFVRLTAPGVGVSVEDAWYALHRRESMRRDEQAGRLRLAQAVAASCRRPKEGGGGASALIAADYRSLSRAEQLRVKKRIAEAASRGEKIYP